MAGTGDEFGKNLKDIPEELNLKVKVTTTEV